MEQFKRMQQLAGLITEGMGAYEYEKGKEAGEKIEKKKMKKSELKKQIKEMILAEMDIDMSNDDNFYDFLAEDELDEAKKKKKEEVEDVEIDTNIDMGGEMDMGTEMDTTPVPAASDVQKELMDALEAAKASGDEKLIRQIGNALTYFTRSQVSKEENPPAMKEALSMDAMERMEGLANIQDLYIFKKKLNALTLDWTQDGFEKEDIIEYISELINQSTTLNYIK
jgi:hypothetical protein